ncbi:efflux RND transporter permease subunit [bacterium]|nr:efflux RND transporter permease subunit [bacterium]
MFLSDISIKRPIMMSMILLVFVFFGVLSYKNLNLELTPEIAMPIITVQTVYPGAGPQEVEVQVSKKIEDAISSVSEIDFTQSYSMENVSYILINFDLNKDVYIALQEVKDKVDGILNDLPTDAEIPLVQRYDPTVLPVVDIILSGPVPIIDLYDLADKDLKSRFAQISGVATVNLTGGQEREITVTADSKTVLQQSVTLQQIAGVLAAQNIDMPGGNIERRNREYSVRLKGEFGDIETIRNIEIPTSHGIKKLGDITNISDTGAEVRERTTFYDRIAGRGDDNVIQLSIMKSSGSNAVRIYDAIIEALPGIEKTLPEGCRLNIVNESSTFTRGAVSDTVSNILAGIILTAFLILLFLHDYKSTIIVALSMPMSIISTFLFMRISGFTLNIMSLMGLSTAVGVLVTNSIVVLENIFRHKSLGHDRIESASKGTSEIAIAVLASTLTNLIVFLPIATIPGIAGRLFKQFSLTVVFATIFSLIMSFTLTPMLASLILPDHDTKKHPIGKWLEGVFRSWENVYRAILSWVFKSRLRGLIIVVITVALLAFSLKAAKTISISFVPPMDEGRISIMVELPSGSTLDETARVMETIGERVHHHPEVSHTWTTLGTQGETNTGINLAAMNVKLVGQTMRKISTQSLVGIMTRELMDIPNADIRVSSVFSITSGRQDLEFDLLGNDIDSLMIVSDKLADSYRKIPGLINLTTSSRSGKPEISIAPYREKLADAGLTTTDIALAVRGGIDGLVYTHYKDRGEEYDIRVKMSRETVDSPEKIGNMPIIGHSGTYRLSQLADITFSEGYDKIMHKNRSKEIKFGVDIAGGYAMGDIKNEIQRVTEAQQLPPGYELDWGLIVKEMDKTTRGIAMAFIIAVVLTYMLLAAILENMTQPAIILLTVPLGMIGVIWSIVLTGISMNIISMLSIVMLIGIVVNNAILQLDYTNTLVRERNMSIGAALLEACPTKLKPILMSNIAIILGMLPMALGIGSSGKEMRQPMGVVSIGGLIVSTMLSLFFIPVVYNMISRKKRIKP